MTFQPARRRLFKIGAVMFAVMAIPPGYYAVTLPWFPTTDFDIIGFLWVLQNLPRLTAWVMTIGFAFGAIVLTLRARWDV